MGWRDRGNQDGFTLFEAIVALAVLTLGLGAFYRAVTGGAVGGQRIERAAMALEVAKARLAVEGIEGPLIEGERQGGEPSGYRWTIRVQRYNGGAARITGSDPIAYLVTANVTWPGARATSHPGVELTTIKIAAAP
jgi:general secretion pathway protein I